MKKKTLAWACKDIYGLHIHTIRKNKQDSSHQYWSSSVKIIRVEIKEVVRNK